MISERINGLCEILQKNTAALITDDAARLYFTGFKASAGAVLITKEQAYFLIDFRYYEKAAETVGGGISVILCERMLEQLNSILKNERIEEILLESDTVTLSFYQRLKTGLSDFTLRSDGLLSEQINKLRAVKSESEIKAIKKAQELTDKAFSYILGKIGEGVTEREIMLQLEFFARKHGSEGVAFDYIVVSGKNSSLPHGAPTEKKIENGDFVTMDFGCVTDGYRSDMTRTVAVGDITSEQRHVYETVLRAQLAALEAIKAGKQCCEIDAVARDLIYAEGFNGCFGHGLGHSVGIEIHESPAFNTRDTTLLKSGMIMTVEPGIYLENRFGVRIEDMGCVTENGFDNFTASPKGLIVL